MGRRPRIHYPGAVYHVMARGVDRRDIYMDAQDRISFLESLNRIKAQTNTTVIAYCLMGNHFHLAIRVDQTPLSDLMQRILTNHAITFNQRHTRTGHLFEARHRANLCLTDAYLISLIRYIHMNPVRAGLVDHPEKWPWSSYQEHQARGQDPMVSSEQDLPNFDPWPKPMSLPSLIRPEPITPMSLGALTELISEESGAEPAELRSRSKRRQNVAAKRLFVRRAIKLGYRPADAARWLNISACAITRLLATESKECKGLTPGNSREAAPKP